MCSSCHELNIEFRIRLPSDLRQAIAITRNHLVAGALRDVTIGGNCRPFDELVSSGKWDAVLHYRFQCKACGQLFELHAETYHGLGGWWKPVE